MNVVCAGPSLVGLAEVLASILGGGAQFLFDSQDLIVLGQTLRAAWGARLDLAGRQTNHQVGDRRVLGLARTMRNHGAPTILLGQQMTARANEGKD